MRRARVADWCAGIAAIIVFALGGLVVVKPAADHWNDVYRGDPYRAETTTQMQRTKAAGKPAVRTTVTTKESSSYTERALGKGGLLLLRLALVAVTAFLVAAVVQRIILGNYGLRARHSAEPAAPATPRRGVSSRPDEPRAAEKVAASENGRNGEGRAAPAEANSAELASSIGKFVAWRREELGLSQRELAKRAGISHTVISRLESGQQVPSPKTLERLAEAFRE
jgi:DNA-binding XRE family transcriptional regulator